MILVIESSLLLIERFKKIEYEFNMIDTDRSGYLQKSELINYMSKKLGPQFN